MKLVLSLLTVAGMLLLPATASAQPAPPPPPPPGDSGGDDPDTLVVDDEPEPEPEPEDADTSPALDTSATSDAAATEDDIDAEDTTEKKDPEEEKKEERTRIFQSKYLTVGGYVQPQYTFLQRTGSRARFQREFGAQQTRAGIKFSGEPLERWSYMIHVVVGAQLFNSVSGVNLVDFEGDGAIDDVVVDTQVAPGLGIEQLWVTYRPVQYKPKNVEIVGFRIVAGQFRAPVSRQNQIQNDRLLFPRRNAASDVFFGGRRLGETTLGPDVGAMAGLDLMDAKVQLRSGIFNGTGFAINTARTRGPFYVTRLDIEPLGAFGLSESELDPPKNFMFGVGGAFGYRPYRVFDAIGNDTLTRVRDVYGNATAYMTLFGLKLQGEFLRRQTTDNLSSRPSINTGAYAQLSYAIPLPKRIHLVPQGNFSYVLVDQAANPQRRMFTEDGIGLYLGNEIRDDAIRIVILYRGEWRLDEQESAQGGTVQLQLKF